MLFKHLLLASSLTGALAAPTFHHPLNRRGALANPTVINLTPASINIRNARIDKRSKGAALAPVATAQAAAAGAKACAAPTAGQAATAQEAEGEEGAKEEVDIDAAFGQQVNLVGGNIKQDTLLTQTSAGSLEVEFQGAEAAALLVTENKTPAAPPAGFAAVESSSFIVQLAGGSVAGGAITLQKIDYIFNVADPAVAALDLASTKVGKLSADGCAFAIEEGIEFEFEAEENEISLTVDDANGEWGIFIPSGSQGATAGAAANATGSANAIGAPAGAEAAVDAEGAEGDEVLLDGTFDTPTAVDGGNTKTDITFTENASGALEVEYNGTAANLIQVTQKTTPSGQPPSGFLFVDPTTFVVATQDATDPATDTVKIDYFYSAAVDAAIDVKQATIGKLDAASGTFVVQGVGEFELEEEENEFSLTVSDLNGEWAVLVPRGAVLEARK